MLYSFEEGLETPFHRAEAVNIPVRQLLDRGTLRIEEIQPFDVTADVFAGTVRQSVEEEGPGILMIDGIGGYRKSLLGVTEDGADEIAALGRYLTIMGVTTIVVNEVHQITGEFQVTESGTSYLADTNVFLGQIEHRGELRTVIGVLEKRTSDYEKRMRKVRITEHWIPVGDPMPDLRGILTGRPEIVESDETDTGAPRNRGRE